MRNSALAHLDTAGILISTYATNGVAALPTGMFGNLLQLAPDHQVVAGISVGPSSESVAATSLGTTGAVCGGR